MKRNNNLDLSFRTRRSVYLAAASLIAAAVIYVTLPFGTAAQKPSDDEFKPSGESVTLSGRSGGWQDRKSAGYFQEMKANSAKEGTSVAKAKSAAGTEMTYYFINIEYKTAAGRKAVFTDLKTSNVKDAYVVTVFDRFADVFVQNDAAYTAIVQNPNILSWEISRKVVAPPPPVLSHAKLPSEGVPEQIIRGGFGGMTGKNVIIAVLDTGVDFRHADFITDDARGLPTSRIAYLWDTDTPFEKGRGGVAPVKFPNGTSIGTLYTRDQLTAELRSTSARFPATDLDGHGTACASIAAGNGRADQQTTGLKRREVVGVAPEATIIGVRLGHKGLENAYLLNAIAEWLETVAGKTPLVISGSFGGHGTGHDGQSIRERHLNTRFALTKPGRAVVFAAGNEGNDQIHAKVDFTSTLKYVSWNAREAAIINIFFDSADQTLSMNGTAATPLAGNVKWEMNAITQQYEATLDVKPGPGGIWIQSKSGKPGVAHLYFKDRDYGTFSPESAVQTHLVGTPGAMENAITVGSYDWNDTFHESGRVTSLESVCLNATRTARMPIEIGWLSCYSSPGPSRNGAVKPEIVAPGEWFASADAKVDGVKSAGWDEDYPPQVDSTGFYRAMNGTSAATPYTSGIVALMFQKKPLLTLGEVRTLLKRETSKSGLNPFSQGTPNSNWGYGKLDTAAVERIFASIK